MDIAPVALEAAMLAMVATIGKIRLTLGASLRKQPDTEAIEIAFLLGRIFR